MTAIEKLMTLFLDNKIKEKKWGSTVNNRRSLKTSHLTEYNYIHYFINHRYDLVSKLFKEIHTHNRNSMERNQDLSEK